MDDEQFGFLIGTLLCILLTTLIVLMVYSSGQVLINNNHLVTLGDKICELEHGEDWVNGDWQYGRDSENKRVITGIDCIHEKKTPVGHVDFTKEASSGRW